MKGIIFDGRTGNQLFQYAFIYSEAKRHRQHFFYSLRHFPEYKLYYFKLRYGGAELLINRLFEFISSILYKKGKLYSQIGNEDIQEVIQQANSASLYKGYFQSERYFKDYQTDIIRLFQVKKKYIKAFQIKYADLFNSQKVAIIHVRRTDYKDFGNEELGYDLTLPFQYYDNFFTTADLTGYKIIFISDDIDAVKLHFGESSNFLYESNSEIIDFQLLLNADLLCISNSSFAWWGAYLNPKKDKIIYAPNYWLGFKIKKNFPVGIHCNDWILLQSYCPVMIFQYIVVCMPYI